MRVFLSSTFKDLHETRKEIESVIRQSDWDTRQMEFFSARPTDGLETSIEEVRKADLVVLVIANRYGSINANSGKSITHHEFLEAMRCHIPVLAFVVAPQPGDAPRTSELEAFIGEVGNAVVYQRVDDLAQIPASALAALNRYINEHGEPGRSARVFPNYESYFSGLLDQTATFNHRHGLQGRAKELESLQSFLKSEQLACIVIGPGGSGKSKLIYELATWCSSQNRSEFAEIRFLRAGLPLSADAFRELPAHNVCIVIDDAHRLHQLENIVEACRAHRTVSKILLTSRPGAIGTADLALRTISENRITRIVLQPLDEKNHAMALATACLSPTVQHQAGQLVAIAGGNPLIITIGAHLLSTSEVSAELLQQREEFIRAALAGLLEAVPDVLAEGVRRDRLLGVLSAIQPFSPSDSDFVQKLGQTVDTTPSSIALAIDSLRRAGLLLERGQRGQLARITPDVLGDHILHDLALTSTGNPTGFVDEVFEKFGATHLGNILLNGAELDWRTAPDDENNSVLGRVWEDIRDSLAENTYRQRQALLRNLQRPATFAPLRALSIVEWCIGHDTAPTDDDPVAVALNTSQQEVLDVAGELLGIIGRHPEFAQRCAEHLWYLARDDTRNPNPRPEHPIRLLRDLATYRTDNDLRTIEGVLRGLDEIINSGDYRSDSQDISAIIGESLEREVEYRNYDERTFTMSARPLAIDRVRAQRDHALRLLRRIAEGQDIRAAAQALHPLTQLLYVPHFKFGRETTEEDLEAFLPEAEAVVGILSSIAIEAPHQSIRYLAHRSLIEVDAEDWPALNSRATLALEQIPEPRDKMLFDALSDKTPRRFRRMDWRDREKAAYEHRQVTANNLWSSEDTVDKIIERLAPVIDELERIGRTIDGRLLFSLANTAANKGKVKALSDAIIASEFSGIRRLTPIALRIFRDQGMMDEFIESLSGLANSDDPELKRVTADGLRWCLYDGGEPGDRELALVRRFVEDSDPMIRAAALESLSRLGKTTPQAAIEVLVSSDWGDDPLVAGRALSSLGESYGIDPALLKDEHIESLVWKLRPLRSLNESDHDIVQFLEFASRQHPICVVQMLLARIDDSTTPGHTYSDGYRPIPHLSETLRLANIQDPDTRLAVLREIRDQARHDSWQHAEYLPRLYSSFVSNLSDAVTVCMEWGFSDDAGKVRAASSVLRAMSEGVIWSAHSQFADMLENAKRLSDDCYQDVCSNLHSVALIKGARFVDPDEPDPVFVRQAELATEMARRYEARPTVAAFFSSLADSAQTWIEMDRARLDEEPPL